MLFSSLTFLFIFLPFLVFTYFIIKKRTYKNFILLIFSLAFYAWGEPKYIFLMILTIIISYIFGILISNYDKKNKLKNKKIALILSVILIIGNLFYFKYFNFFFNNINSLFKTNIVIKNVVLPIGISFYTFQILSYIIDLYNKKIDVQKNVFSLALYVTLFPQLIAGPIVRYQTVENELSNRKETIQDFCNGLKRFIIGLSKKVIISNNVALIADFIFDNFSIYNSTIGSAGVWLGAFAYALQIYYDFSGYSDMAIGLGKMFGFNFLENFNYPYISKSITDFWRRWHISLSTWFRDYIYIPLGGNRVSKTRWIINILIVWSLTGLWHGASWNFVLWGLYFALILIIEKLFLGKYLKKMPTILKWIYSMILIIVGWVIFRSENLNNVLSFIITMFSFQKTDFIKLLAIKNLSVPILYMVPAIVFMFPIYNKFQKKHLNSNKFIYVSNFIYLCLFIICIMFLTSSNYNPFIYFRF